MRNTSQVNFWALVAVLLLCSAWSGGASAAPSPAGFCWDACFYEEPSLQSFSKHVVCFQNSPKTWSATTQNWTGRWFQKGDRVRWYGNTQSGLDTLATAAFGQFSSPDVMTGEYAEWIVPGTPNSKRFNYVMFRFPVTQCP